MTDPIPEPAVATVGLAAAYKESGVGEVLADLDRNFIGLGPVKMRIKQIAAHLLVERARKELGCY